jgi:hypothetical protein
MTTRLSNHIRGVLKTFGIPPGAMRGAPFDRFTALFHHLSPAMLRTAFLALKRDAAPGIDGLTW